MSKKPCTCQMTMGEYRNFYECGKPAKYSLFSSLHGKVIVICGTHARAIIRRKHYVGAMPVPLEEKAAHQ